MSPKRRGGNIYLKERNWHALWQLTSQGSLWTRMTRWKLDFEKVIKAIRLHSIKKINSKERQHKMSLSHSQFFKGNHCFWNTSKKKIYILISIYTHVFQFLHIPQGENTTTQSTPHVFLFLLIRWSYLLLDRLTAPSTAASEHSQTAPHSRSFRLPSVWANQVRSDATVNTG